MNERIKELMQQAGTDTSGKWMSVDNAERFLELVTQDMHRKVIASILITDVVMEERGQEPTSEDYIKAINKDFGIEQ